MKRLKLIIAILIFYLFCSDTNFIVSLTQQMGLRRVANPAYPRHQRERVLGVLGFNGGDLHQVADYLKISVEDLGTLIDKYGLEDELKKIEEIVAALKLARGVISQAAEILKISHRALTQEIHRLYLNMVVLQVKERADRILQSVGKAGGDLSMAAEFLRVDMHTLVSEIKKYGLEGDVRELSKIIEGLKAAGGNITQAGEFLDVAPHYLQRKIMQYRLQIVINEIKREREEIIMALGKNAGDLRKTSEALDISLAQLETLLSAYNLKQDLEKIRETVDVLMKTRANQKEAAGILRVSQAEVAHRIRDYYLSSVVIEIGSKIEEILSALGMSGGDLKQASLELGIDETILSMLVDRYNLTSEIDEIRTYYSALEHSDWNFSKAADNLGIPYYEFIKKVDRYYLRLSRSDERENIIFALAKSRGDIFSAAEFLKISEIELQGLIRKYDLYETQVLIRDMVLAYQSSQGRLEGAGDAFGKTREWFRTKALRLYLSPALYKIDGEIEYLIEVLGKSGADLELAAEMLGTTKTELLSQLRLYGLDKPGGELDKITQLANGLKRTTGNMSELAEEIELTTEAVRTDIIRYYLSVCRYEINKRIEEILVALGETGANLNQASEDLGIPENELRALIILYGLWNECQGIEVKARSLKRAQGRISWTIEPSLFETQVTAAYLDTYVYHIQKEIERILYAFGESEGDLEKTAAALGFSLSELKSLITHYSLSEELENITRIIEAIKQTGGDISAAAGLLEIDTSTLKEKMHRYYLTLLLSP